MVGLTTNIIAVYIKNFLDAKLNELEEQRINRDIPNNSLMDELDIYPDMVQDYQFSLSNGDYSIVDNEINDFISNTNIKVYKGTTEYKKLARELIKTRIKILQIDAKRAKGDYDLYEQHISSNISAPIQIQSNITLKILVNNANSKNNRNFSPKLCYNFL